MKSNYLFYFCEGIGSVFDSQVVALLKSINEKNIFNKIYLFLGVRNEEQKNEIQKRNITGEINLVLFKLHPNYPFFNFMIRMNLRKAIKNTDVNLEEVIFHTRGEIMAWHLSKVLENKYRKNVLPDIRGASAEEILEFSKYRFTQKKLKVFNYESSFKYLTRFNQISAVSNYLKVYLTDKYKNDPLKIHITPCLSGPNFRFDKLRRNEIRNELKLSNDDILIIFSSGGTANWQNSGVLKILADKELKVLNLSKREIQHKNIINKFVSHDGMPSYLNAADVAIIWREESIVNKVASPVKFSEYVCCGLPVISNQSVDMIKEYIVKNSCGFIMDRLDDIDLSSLRQLKLKDRSAIAETGLCNFGVEAISKSYIQIYSEMKNKIILH